MNVVDFISGVALFCLSPKASAIDSQILYSFASHAPSKNPINKAISMERMAIQHCISIVLSVGFQYLEEWKQQIQIGYFNRLGSGLKTQKLFSVFWPPRKKYM